MESSFHGYVYFRFLFIKYAKYWQISSCENSIPLPGIRFLDIICLIITIQHAVENLLIEFLNCKTSCSATGILIYYYLQIVLQIESWDSVLRKSNKKDRYNAIRKNIFLCKYCEYFLKLSQVIYFILLRSKRHFYMKLFFTSFR